MTTGDDENAGAPGMRSPLEHMAAVLDAVGDHIWLATPRLDHILYTNSAYERIFGEPVASLYAEPRSFLALLDDADRARLSQRWAGGQRGPQLDELVVHRRDGTVRRVRARSFPVLDDQGRVQVVAGITEDVTEQAAARAALSDTNRRLTAILEGTSEGVIALDGAWRFTFVNPAALAVTGHTERELAGRTLWEAFPALGAEPIAEVLGRVMRTGCAEAIDCHVGTWRRWLHGRVVRPDEDLVVVFHDVTEARRAAMAERRQHRLLELANVAVTSLTDNRIRFWNLGAELQYGFPAEQAVGAVMGELLQTRYPVPYDDIAAQVRGTGTWAGTLVHRTRDGREVTVASQWSLHRDEATGVEMAVEVNHDITALRAAQAESSHLADQLHRAERLDALGQLASGVAHDFNNLLSVIVNDLHFALDALAADSQEARDVTDALLAAERAAALTQQLLVFARRGPVSPVPVGLDAHLRGLRTLVERTVGAHITTQFDLDAASASVLIDPTRLDQVVLNLVINGRDAMPRGGELRVATAITDVAGDEDLAPGAYACLMVSDTGTGMAPDVLARAAEPFFTTKQASGGSGLGLANVAAAATQAGGAMQIRSAPGAGTTVSVWLPCRTLQGALALGPRRHGVLLVDDRDDVRSVARRILEQAGFRVVEAADAAQALQSWSALADTLDVVVCDVHLPGPAGTELVAELRRRRPGLPAVLMSGYAPEDVGAVGPPLALVAKPFTRSDLLGAVEQALAPDSGA